MGSLFLEGLVLQASLILALGAQNIFVLEAGLKRQHHLIISFVCFLCDLTLILLGVAGAATLFTYYPGLKVFIGVLGVSFLFTYGMSKLFSGSTVLTLSSDPVKSTLKRSVILAMTFSILNPHAYLDAFILIGGFSSKYDALEDRIILGLGAGVYSGIWFLILSSLSSVMKPVLQHPVRMKVIMSLAGIVLIILSGKLSIDVLGWIGIDVKGSYSVSYPVSPGNVFTSILF